MIDLVADDVAALDRDYVDAVVGGGRGHLASIVTERIGTGQVAVTVRATLCWTNDDPSLPTTVVVKVAATEPGTPERQRRSTTYRREVCFYRHLASRIATSVPACHHAAHDSASGGFTIVLDEVSGAVGDQLRGCTIAEAEAVVDAAVGLHAPTWADGTLTAFDWLHASDDESRRARVERYHLLLPGFTARYAARLSPAVIGVAHWLLSRLHAIERATRLPECLTHQDLRIDNMLFTSKGAEPIVTVLDWQTVGLGSGPSDLAYAIGSGLVADTRRAHEWRLVDRYIEGLRCNGIVVDGDDVRHDYRLGAASGMVMAVIASQSVGRTERGDELFAVLAERHAQQMIDMDLDELVD